MKKIILSLFVVAFAISCSKNESIDINSNLSKKISFSSYVESSNSATKTYTMNNDKLTFAGVFATTTKDDLSYQFIPNTMINRDWVGKDEHNQNIYSPIWNTSAEYFWPTTEEAKTLYFYGYYPYFVSDGSEPDMQYKNFTKDSGVITDYPQVGPYAYDMGQPDVMVGYAEKDVHEASNNLDNNNVTLKFEHVLSKVGVNIDINANNENGTGVGDYLFDDYNPETGKYDDGDDSNNRITCYYDLFSVGLINLNGKHDGLDLVNKRFIIDENDFNGNYHINSGSYFRAVQMTKSNSGVDAFYGDSFNFMILPQKELTAPIIENGKLKNLDAVAAIKINIAIEQFGHFIVGSYKGAGEYKSDNIPYENINSGGFTNGYSINDIEMVTAYFPIYTDNVKSFKQSTAYYYKLDIGFGKKSLYLGYDKDGNLILDDDDKITLSAATGKWNEQPNEKITY